LSATNDSGVKRYALPGVPNPILPADIANRASVDAAGGANRLLDLGSFSQGVANIEFICDIVDVDMDDVFYVECTFSIETNGLANLQMQINGDTTANYLYSHVLNDAGTLTADYTGPVAAVVLAPATILDAARVIAGWIKFYRWRDAAGVQQIAWSGMLDAHGEGTCFFTGRLEAVHESLTTIRFVLSGNLIDTETRASFVAMSKT